MGELDNEGLPPSTAKPVCTTCNVRLDLSDDGGMYFCHGCEFAWPALFIDSGMQGDNTEPKPPQWDYDIAYSPAFEKSLAILTVQGPQVECASTPKGPQLSWHDADTVRDSTITDEALTKLPSVIGVNDYCYLAALKRAIETRNSTEIILEDAEYVAEKVERTFRAMLIDTRVNPDYYYADEDDED